MPKFTPGPWKLYSHSLAPWEQHRIENDHGNHVCELVEADQADARLIAAAPELYAAVQAVSECESCLDENGKQFLKVPASSIFDLGAELEALLAKVDGGN